MTQATLTPRTEAIRAETTNTVLTFQEVGKTFPTSTGPYVAVRDVSLEIGRGEFISLIGHSGCGKSTLLNMAAGLAQPTSGAILLDGKPITSPGSDRSMVFQNYSLLPWLTVRENVYEAVDSAFGDLTRDEKAAQTDRFLEMVGLAAAAQKKPHQLSGGMKQRVAIARAFSVHPKVLLLDEPFGALDALTKSALHEELVTMWSLDRKTETVLMVTHDIDEAIYLSDRVVVMTNGPAATVGEIVSINVPRPRDRRSMIHDPAYTEARDRLLFLLTEAYQGHEASE
ncbi:MAG: ABC transporter ATP-binding protein [Chloroflexota bacterium]